MADTPAGTQTREGIDEFKEKCKQFDLGNDTILNIINTRPASVVEIYAVCYYYFLLLFYSFVIVFSLFSYFPLNSLLCIIFLVWLYVLGLCNYALFAANAFVFVPCIVGRIGTALD